MSSVNNILFSVQHMAPALLSIGGGAAKSNNYDALAALNSSLFGTNSTNGNALLNSLFGANSSSSSNFLGDKVSLNYKNIGDRIINDMAGVTAEAIKKHPELDKDYVIAIVDNGTSREARVYSRKDILANFEGTAKQKETLEKELAANPLMVFSSGVGLPDTKEDAAYQELATNLNDFLRQNNKNMNTLANAGYNPLEDMLADRDMKKILINYAEASDEADDLDETDKSKDAELLGKKLLKELKAVIGEAVNDESALENNYVVAIIDNNGEREARVYKRSDILNNFVGTEEEKKKVEQELKANPLMTFLNGNGLPESESEGAFGELAAALNTYLADKKGDFDTVDEKGHNPLVDLLGSSNVKKALANYLDFM